jgi:predicted transposase YbfD/YdcC
MECIAALSAAARVFDLRPLVAQLEQVRDRRHRKGLRYELAPLLVLIVLAKLAGEDRPSGIADWLKARGEELRVVLALPWSRMPHHNTIRRVLASVVLPSDLEVAVSAHLRRLPGVGQSALIAIDGKTVRGTIHTDNPQGEHLLAAYLPEEGIVLGQVAVRDGHGNEISAAPTLLQDIDLRGKIVAGDAMHTQRGLSEQILDAGGHYLWWVKNNQPTLRADLEHLFTADPTTVLGGQVPTDFQTARQVNKGHGRRERRAIVVSQHLNAYLPWPGVVQVFQLTRQRRHPQTGHQENETVYGLTSLPAAEAPPLRLLTLVRQYWGIENGLHYRRDVTCQEDRTRLTTGRAGWVMATLNNLVIGLFRHAGATNLAEARRAADAALTKTITRLSLSPIS